MHGMGSWVLKILFTVALLTVTFGCVRRTMKITTEPSNALVYLNDQEVGRSELSVDFLWYGDYDVIIRKEGFETLQTHWEVKAPWYQLIPFDFFAEVFWPGNIHDVQTRHFVMEPRTLPTSEELTERAAELRTETSGGF